MSKTWRRRRGRKRRSPWPSREPWLCLQKLSERGARWGKVCCFQKKLDGCCVLSVPNPAPSNLYAIAEVPICRGNRTATGEFSFLLPGSRLPRWRTVHAMAKPCHERTNARPEGQIVARLLFLSSKSRRMDHSRYTYTIELSSILSPVDGRRCVYVLRRAWPQEHSFSQFSCTARDKHY